MIRRFLCAVPAALVVSLAAGQSPPRSAIETEIAFLEARLGRDEADPITPTRLGHAYLKKARESADFSAYRRAEVAFRLALTRSPEYFAALTGLASALSARHAFADALTVGERAITANPEAVDGYAVAGDAALEAGLLSKAAELYARVARLAPGYHSDTRFANLAAARGETDKAHAALAAAARAATAGGLGNDLRAWPHIRSGVLAFEHGDWTRAQRSYQAALRITPTSAVAIEHLAELRAAEGRHAEALNLYGRAVEITPLAEYHAAVGAIHQAQGRKDLAIVAFERARQGFRAAVEAGDPGVYRQLALFYADIEAQPAEAVKWARKDLEIRTDPVTLGILAWTLMKSGALEEAAEVAARAAGASPVDAMTWYRAGLVALEKGDAAEGKARLARAVKINPRLKTRIPVRRGRG